MRVLILSLLAFVFAVSAPALAADEFGSRFGETETPALSDPASTILSDEDTAQALQDIAPAAGEEEDDASPIGDVVPNTDEIEDESGDPALLKTPDIEL